MEDKYRLLGLDPGRSEAKIKETYEKLQKMYDPDKFKDAGQKKYARERLEEFKKAYDEIMARMAQNSASASASSGPYAYEYGKATQQQTATQYQPNYQRVQQKTLEERFSSKREFYSYIRRLLQKGRYAQAEDELSRYPDPGEAEWNFLKGSVLYYTGYVNQAYDYFQDAVNLRPNNREYSNIFLRMRQSRMGRIQNNRYSRGRSNDMSSLCEDEDFLCQMLICLSCLRGR